MTQHITATSNLIPKNNPMITKSKIRALLAGVLLCTAGVASAQTSNSIVTFSVDMGTNIVNGTFVPGTDTISVHGTFNGWGTGVNLIQQGSTTVYTNTADDTSDANGGYLKYKFVNSDSAFSGSGGYENLCDGGGNRVAKLPATSGSSLVLPTPFYADSGAAITYTSTLTFQVDMSQQINLGNFVPGTSTASISGNFEGWNANLDYLTNDPSILETNQYGLVTSNVYVGTFTNLPVSTNAHMAYQFIINGNYSDTVSGPENDGGNNRSFTASSVNQTFPVVFYADAPYAPIVTNITFSVDMTIVSLTDTNFNPASVTVNGTLMGWGGVAMTNNPAAANTNIYTSTESFSDGVGATEQYQYRYTELISGDTVYDHADGANGGNNNRVITIGPLSNTNILNVFNDADLDDYFLQPTPVLFSVNMTNAVGTDEHVFNPSTDNVYINGTFSDWYAWAGGVNPAPAPAGYQMLPVGTSLIYTNIIVCPPGPVTLTYKYGMDPGALNGGPDDDEAPSGDNHNRVLRSTGFNPYVMAQDTFGNQYSEPVFDINDTAGGDLSVGPVSSGKVPVSWLGRPGAQLQVSTNLNNPVWQSIPVTDGTNWTFGYSSTNGFVSVTNWVPNGKTFFRLIKP